MKKTKEKNYVKRLFCCECIIMSLILFLSMIAIICVCLKAGENPKAISLAIEGTLLSDGLAIVGMAISVWAGLSIIQVLEKNKLLELEREVQEYKRERRTLNKRLFLDNILEDKNELNLYIYRKIIKHSEHEKEEISAELFFELNQIETAFREVYRKRMPISQQHENEYYDELVDRCRKLEDRLKTELSNPEIYLEYIKIRILEFNFYKGYTKETQEDKEEVVSCFDNVIDGFCEIFSVLKQPEKLTKYRHYLDKNVSLTIYMLNTLGESYSKIIETYGDEKKITEEMQRKALLGKKYFKVLFELLESDQTNNKAELKRNVRETYYRNYGCLLERISKNIDKDKQKTFVCDGEIYAAYQKALELALGSEREIIRHQPFYTYLSFYVKVMRVYDIENKLHGRKKSLNEEQQKYRLYTYRVLYYAELAEKIFPAKHQFFKFRAYIERDYAIWEILDGHHEQASIHLNVMEKYLEQFRLFEEGRIALGEKVDDALKELENSLSMVKKVLKNNRKHKKVK